MDKIINEAKIEINDATVELQDITDSNSIKEKNHVLAGFG